jgi:hypothetical protein
MTDQPPASPDPRHPDEPGRPRETSPDEREPEEREPGGVVRVTPADLGLPDEGGEPACYAHLVCPECGCVVTEGHSPGCSEAAG